MPLHQRAQVTPGRALRAAPACDRPWMFGRMGCGTHFLRTPPFSFTSAVGVRFCFAASTCSC
eukprot:11213558-Lingulodinium_polyedra.AAC.1